MTPKYKKMLAGMLANEKKSGSSRRKLDPWFLYILKCADGTLYTGITNNLERRLKAHSAGRASRFTRVRLPIELLYQEACVGRTQALVRECAVKAFPRSRKLELVQFGKSGSSRKKLARKPHRLRRLLRRRVKMKALSGKLK